MTEEPEVTLEIEETEDRYLVLNIFSRVASEFPWYILAVCGVLGLLIGWQFVGTPTAAVVSLFIFVFLIGVPAILFGQMSGVFLQQYETLVDIRNLMKNIPPEPAAEPEKPAEANIHGVHLMGYDK